MNKGIFVTGTGTDVGKTIITTGLIKLYRSNGIDAVPMKPVQTGCHLRDGKFVAPDLDFAIKYSGISCNEEELELMAPHCYEPACSPHLAGNLSDKYPEIKNIIPYVKKLEELREFLIVEGAGGIMVPLNKNEMMIDLMKKIGYPAIIVAHTELGTINHTLLSIQALRNADIEIMGVIFNNTTPPSPESNFIRKDNIKTIERSGKVNILGNIDYIENLNNNTIEKAFAELQSCEDVVAHGNVAAHGNA